MRNLQLIYNSKYKLDIQEPLLLTPDSNQNGTIYICTASHLFAYNTMANDLQQLYETPQIVGCEYLTMNNEICMATQSGEVIVYNLNTKTAETVSFCEDGIEKMSWCPDQEVVVFVTKTKNIVVMNCTYDPISESSLEDTSFGDQEFITVGWGKKETQFHGTEGKQAAKQKSDFIQPDNIAELDQSIMVSWRGDGDLYAISFVSSLGRMFKVYNKEGQLQFTSEKLNNLGAAIAWKPSGTWIAIPHLLPNKYTIALFEKNGLRHREIVLPFQIDDETIVNLSWSSDSSILAVETVKDGNSNIYMYTMCNYHWYLKQSLNFTGSVQFWIWDSDINETKTMHVLMADGTYLLYRWTLTSCYFTGNTIENESIVTVIDGKKLLLTDFRNNVIPPPMSSYSLDANANINETGFQKSPQHKFFTLTSDNKFSTYDTIFEKTAFSRRLTSVKLQEKYDVDKSLNRFPLELHHWHWLSDSIVIFCKTTEKYSKIFLGNLNGQTKVVQVVDERTLEGLIGNITEVTNNKFVIYQTNGYIYSMDIVDNKLSEPNFIYELPELCEHSKVIEIDGGLKIFSLKENQNFYINDTKVATDVTSFFVTEKYVVYTLLSCLKFMRLSDDVVVNERKMERGGKLVVIVPKDSRTVIQMPRGNLEIIQPRVLSLCIVGDLLDTSQYKRAMEILRKQRINLNIMVDHNPKKFLSEIDQFLYEISNPQWLNLFLTDLQNEDYTQTMYSSNYRPNHIDYPENYTIANKINFLCDRLCEKMILESSERFILPIITSYVKKGDLEKALDLIWSEKKKEKFTGVSSRAEEALRYLLYLADVNDLYNIALGMYDFGLVLFVANKSQKDPKEYIPFLNELKKLEPNYCKFKIDEYLKRNGKALSHIVKCGEDRFNECLEFVQKHKLYSNALFEYEGNEICYKQMALAFADYLRSNGKFENASIMYERAGDLQQAIMSAKHVLDWKRCLMIMKVLGKSDEEAKNIALSLVPAMLENSKYDDAYHLLKTYGNDYEQALNALFRGRQYMFAIFETRMSDQPELVETVIKPHLLSYKTILFELIKTDTEQFLRHKNRLLTVRAAKLKKDTEQPYEDGVDECDLLSDTSSMNSSKFSGSSKGTGKTFRSSKNRRKHERKLLNLKEGSPFEDIALIDALYNMITRIFAQQIHIRYICKTLMEITLDRDAREVQKAFAELLHTIQCYVDEIWIPEMMTAQQLIAGPNIDYATLQNEQHYAMIKPHQRFKPQLTIIDWQHDILQ